MSEDFLTCPITQTRLVDPVVDPEGNTYEKSAILEWLSKQHTSPITRTHLTPEMLAPNRIVASILATSASTCPDENPRDTRQRSLDTRQRTLPQSQLHAESRSARSSFGASDMIGAQPGESSVIINGVPVFGENGSVAINGYHVTIGGGSVSVSGGGISVSSTSYGNFDPRGGSMVGNNDNNDNFNNNCQGCKRCNGCRNCMGCKDCLECSNCTGCKDCKDCKNCTGCMDCLECSNCTGCKDCKDCNNCTGCKDCTDCINCTNCAGCVGLRNQSGLVGVRHC